MYVVDCVVILSLTSLLSLLSLSLSPFFQEREVHRQRIARQREEDNQRRAQERTMRLLSHLRQQEIERKRRYKNT